ncbi:MAG: FAD-dependent oxidoreductase [Salinisphaera sp.]|nr:FAD-dependent oxidoreductase [Salinisphaera sp.]
MSERTPTGRRQTLLLAGAGHAHVEVLRRHIKDPAPELAIQLISPEPELAYSGMLPATIAGHYQRSEMHIDVAALAGAAGAHCIRARVIDIQADNHRVICDNGLTLDYDLLSLDIGSAEIDLPRTVDAVRCVPVKPLAALWAGIDAMDRLDAVRAHRARIAVVGAGAGGVELVLALAYRCRYWQHVPQFMLYSRTDTVLADHSPAVRRHLVAALRDWNVGVICGKAVERVTAEGLAFGSGHVAPADMVFCATGARAPNWLKHSGLALDDAGFVSVGWDLASTSHERVFAAGDICSLPSPRPKSGVFAIREAPTLAANLQRRAEGRPLRPFDAQKRALALITLGGPRAVASRGWPIAPVGYAVWCYKHWIDSAFMRRYREPARFIID